MNVVLIPYFLAANLVVEDSQPWHFGAEYTYRSILEATSETAHEGNLKIHMNFELKCRNNNDTSLICRTADIQLRSSDSSLEDSVDYIRQELSSPFLITFDENGVETVSISNDKIAPLMKLYQYMASMFHAGVNLTDRRLPATFEARETTVLGDCDTSFKVSQRAVPDTLANEVLKKRNFRLELMDYPGLKPGTAIEIDKVRHTKTCNAANLGINHTPMSSKGKIFIDSAGIFKVDVKDVGKMVEEDGQKRVNNAYRSHLSLELLSIERATDCFITFNYAKTSGLEIEDDDSSSSSSSESDSDSDSESDSDSDSKSESDLDSITDDLYVL